MVITKWLLGGCSVSKAAGESARHSMDRIARLERRMRQLQVLARRSNKQLGEMSAIEWAIPILEKYVFDTWGVEPAQRANWYKHEKRVIIENLLRRDGDICYLCDQPLVAPDITIDHVIPLHRRGRDDTSNYRAVHMRCNVAKGNMALEDYLKSDRRVTA